MGGCSSILDGNSYTISACCACVEQGTYRGDGYVVGKSLDGLFHVLGEEETKIRNSPAARVTPLLKDVFGSLAS